MRPQTIEMQTAIALKCVGKTLMDTLFIIEIFSEHPVRNTTKKKIIAIGSVMYSKIIPDKPDENKVDTGNKIR